MKKILAILILCALCLTGCSEVERLSDIYSIGEEIELGGVVFNIYKVDEREKLIYLLAQDNIATTPFYSVVRDYLTNNNYEGSLVEDYVIDFTNKLEVSGVNVISSGIIDKNDLIDIGFKTDGKLGESYIIDDTVDFIEIETNFWVDGYCKYNYSAWAYHNGNITTEDCEDEYGVRPIIVIDPSEINSHNK